MLTRIVKCLPLVLACIGLLAACTAQPAWATYILTEDFDSEPADWVGSENRTAPNNFGWSDTNYAGGAAAGEAGGLFSRANLAVYWTDVGSLDISSDGLSLSGRGRFIADESDGNSILGWYDSTSSLAWVPDYYMAIRTDQTDVYLEYVADGETYNAVQLASTLGYDSSWSFSLSYDPAGNGGGGTLTASVNGGTAGVMNLAAGDKDLMTNLDRFGLMTLSLESAFNYKNVYYDDLSYTSAIPEPGMAAMVLAATMGLLAYAWRKRR